MSSVQQRNVLKRDVSRASSTLLMSDDYYEEESEYEYNSDDEGDASAVLMDVVAPAGDSAGGGNGLVAGRGAETKFLDQAGLADLLLALLREFTEITCADQGQAARFLRAGHWQLQDATTAYFAAPESETSSAPDTGEPKKGTCMVCADDDVTLSHVGCGHAFCDECWVGYIRQRVTGEGNALFIPCMGFKCKRILGVDLVRSIVARCSDGGDDEETAAADAGGAGGDGVVVGAAAAAEQGGPTVGTAANGSGLGRAGLRLLRGITGGRGSSKGGGASRSASSSSTSSLSTPPDAGGVKQLYERLLANDLVMSHPRLRFCQTPSCGLAALVDDQTCMRVDCECGASFCFCCGSESHVPATCSTLRAWTSKEVGEGETFNWIAANTKDCPSCQSPIEKNHGCNHMTCTKCHYEFCWLCLGKWSNHNSCNAYASEESESTASEAREAIKRYNHYWTRYNVHRQAQKLEGDLRITTQRNINDMFAEQRRLAGQDFTERKLVLEAQNRAAARKAAAVAAGVDADNSNETTVDATAAAAAAGEAASANASSPPEQVSLDVLASTWNILEEATENLINCRRALRFTYIHAYFLKANSKELHLFEFLQAELEAATERLSHVLGTKSTQKMLGDRQEIKQASFDAGGRLKNLVDGVASGGFTVDVPEEAVAVDEESGDAAAAADGSGGRSVLRSVANALRGR